jgi:hypothetical protein
LPPGPGIQAGIHKDDLMRNTVFATSLALATLTLSGVALAAEAKQDFTLVNKTGYEISEVYVSPAKTDDWEEDVLGKDSLDDGESVNIHFKRANKTCMWDLKVVYSDDDSDAVWQKINLCEVSKITIKYNRKSNTTTAFFD